METVYGRDSAIIGGYMSEEIKSLSREIDVTVNNLNILIGRAHALGLRIDIDEFTTQEMQNKWPHPHLQVTVLKEI